MKNSATTTCKIRLSKHLRPSVSPLGSSLSYFGNTWFLQSVRRLTNSFLMGGGAWKGRRTQFWRVYVDTGRTYSTIRFSHSGVLRPPLLSEFFHSLLRASGDLNLFHRFLSHPFATLRSHFFHWSLVCLPTSFSASRPSYPSHIPPYFRTLSPFSPPLKSRQPMPPCPSLPTQMGYLLKM